MHLLTVALATGVIYSICTLGIGVNVQAIVPPSNEPIAQQQSPASTYQPGFWQPAARVNPDNPVTVNIINRSGVPIEYSLTTSPLGVQTLANDGNTQLADLPKDSYVIVNPQSTSSPLRFEITAENNLIKITVQPSSDFSGESTIHLHPTGAIYIY